MGRSARWLFFRHTPSVVRNARNGRGRVGRGPGYRHPLAERFIAHTKAATSDRVDSFLSGPQLEGIWAVLEIGRGLIGEGREATRMPSPGA